MVDAQMKIVTKIRELGKNLFGLRGLDLFSTPIVTPSPTPTPMPSVQPIPVPTATPTPDPCACPSVYTPVCGSDGRTYFNVCVASCEGISIAPAEHCVNSTLPIVTPRPTSSPTPTPGPQGSPTPTPNSSPTPSPTPSGSPTPTPTPCPSCVPTPTPTPTPPPDSDDDGVLDSVDNCPSVANANQWDADENGVGDACDSTVFFYVATNGNDNNPGTLTAPFLTLSKAQTTIRTNITSGMTSNAVVFLRGGKYYLTSGLLLQPPDSGKNGYRVIWRNYYGEKPRLIASKAATGWTLYSGNIYVANIGPNIYSLYENGVEAVPARTPNSGYLKVAGYGDNNFTSFVYPSGALPDTFSYSSAKAYIFPGGSGSYVYDWAVDITPITYVNFSTRTINLSANTSYVIRLNNRFALINSLDFLDSPGEFFYDETTGLTYYWPRNAPIDSQEILAPTIERIIQVSGSSPSVKTSNIELRGLTLEMGNGFKTANSNGPLSTPTGLHVAYADNIRVRFNEFKQLTHGITGGFYVTGLDIYGNYLNELGADAIKLGGPYPGNGDVSGFNRIVNNRFYDFGRRYSRAAGMLLARISSTNVSFNKIHRGNYAGILYLGFTLNYTKLFIPDATQENYRDYVYARNGTIAFNDVSDVMRDTHDGGGIYLWGSGKDNLITNNVIHDITATTQVNNPFAVGMYLDDGSGYNMVSNNLVYNIRTNPYTFLIKGDYNTLTNNIVATDEPRELAFFQAYLGMPNHHLNITRNIFYASTSNALDPTMFKFADWQSDKVSASDYNSFYRPDGRYTIQVGTPKIPLAQWQSQYGFDVNSVTADPQFRNPAAGDYFVQNGAVLATGFTNFNTTPVGLMADFPFPRG